MTITRDQVSSFSPTAEVSSAVVTWSANPTAGAKALVALASSGPSDITSVTDNGTTPATFTLDVTLTAGAADDGVCIYRADNITLPSAGSYKVTITYSAAQWTST
jgi:hypothetical protein